MLIRRRCIGVDPASGQIVSMTASQIPGIGDFDSRWVVGEVGVHQLQPIPEGGPGSVAVIYEGVAVIMASGAAPIGGVLQFTGLVNPVIGPVRGEESATAVDVFFDAISIVQGARNGIDMIGALAIHDDHIVAHQGVDVVVEVIGEVLSKGVCGSSGAAAAGISIGAGVGSTGSPESGVTGVGQLLIDDATVGPVDVNSSVLGVAGELGALYSQFQ